MKREWKPRVSKHITLREPLACGDCSDSAVSSFEQPMRKTPAKNVLLSNLFTIYEHRTSRMPSKWVGYVSMYNVVAWSWNYRYLTNKYFYDWNLLTISCLQNDNICIVAHHVEMFERVQQLKDRFHSSKFLHDMVRCGAARRGACEQGTVNGSDRAQRKVTGTRQQYVCQWDRVRGVTGVGRDRSARLRGDCHWLRPSDYIRRQLVLARVRCRHLISIVPFILTIRICEKTKRWSDAYF